MISDISSLEPDVQHLVEAAVFQCKKLVENEKCLN